MSLSPVKQQILETLLLQEKPVRAMEISKEIKGEFPQAMMHLLGLIRMGYASSPEKGLYVITSKGKEAIGIPEVNKEKAAALLAYAPHDKAFEFYADIGQPLHLHAHTLRDFANKLEKASLVSLEFHMKRDDFEAWFDGFGDKELAKKTALLKQKGVSGEELRRQLHKIVADRYVALAKLAGQPVYNE
jgi:Mn-dependent DtxR family transcriptional regulator